MNQLRTVESKVLEILKEDAEARENDMLLWSQSFGLPCFETIRRARQRVQSCYPAYSRNPVNNDGGLVLVIEIG